MARGKFIVVEGADGSGKTTQVARIHQYLLDRDVPAIKTREPGGTPGAEELRNLVVRGDPGRWDAMTEFLIFSAARRDHLVKCIIPALEAGTWTICDRFTLSTYAMQVHAGGVSVGLFDHVTHELLGDLSPDLTIYLDIDVDTCIARTSIRETGNASFGENRMERKGAEYLGKVLEGYEIGIKHHQKRYLPFPEYRSGRRHLIIDARRDADSVTDAITGELLVKIESADAYEDVLRQEFSRTSASDSYFCS